MNTKNIKKMKKIMTKNENNFIINMTQNKLYFSIRSLRYYLTFFKYNICQI